MFLVNLLRSGTTLLFFSSAVALAQDFPHRTQVLKFSEIQLKSAFAAEHANYNSATATLSQQFLDALGGPPDREEQLDDGTTFYAACRAQSCDEKAAEIVDLNRERVLAVALQHFNCHVKNRSTSKYTKPTYRCGKEASLAIYVFEPRSDEDAGKVRRWVERFQTWGNKSGVKDTKIMYREVHSSP